VDKFLTFGITGLVLAAIYAVIASGLVLTYTTTGIFNFAHGAAGMLAAFTYWQLRFAWNWPAPLALALVLVVLAPAFGLALERFVMRGLHDTSDTVRLVVTIALLSGLIAFARWIWDPNVARPMRRFFASSEPLGIGPTTITVHQGITIGVAVLVAVALRLLLYRTRAGVTMRATVDDRSLAILNGARPDRSTRAAWALGTSLAALGGILIAPNVALDAGGLSLLIVSAYAAAIFGRLRSIPLTFVGAIVVGGAESYLTGYLPTNEYLPGLRLAAPALILFLVLLVLPNPQLRRRRRSRESFPMPSWAGGLAFGAAAVAASVVLATTLAESDLVTYARIFPVAVVALSFVLLAGFSGQISLCQLGLAGIGGLAAAHLAPHGLAVMLLGAALAVGAVGAVIALPALRLSGIYLALGTAAFAMVLDRWVFTLPDFSVLGLFDVRLFDQGSVSVAPPALFGLAFDTAGSQMILSAAVFAVLSLGVVAVRRGRTGRRLLAIKDSEAACATLGGSILGSKVAVFAASAAIAGVGGALYSVQLQTISAADFTFVGGLPVFVLAVVGGIATVGGALFAGGMLNGVLPVAAVLAPAVVKVSSLLPGLAGVALGENPNGMVGDLRRRVRPLAERPAVWIPTAAVGAVAYGLRLAGVIGNWPFVAALLASSAGALLVARRTAARGAADAVPDVPLEWRGLRRPWLAADAVEIDGVLGLTGARAAGSGRDARAAGSGQDARAAGSGTAGVR
jgi:branched-chain amino acid transport system permease protein